MTQMSMNTIVVLRIRYWGISGCSGRMNCGMKARKKTIALGLRRLTQTPRWNMDQAGSLRRASIFSLSRSGRCRNCRMPMYTRYAAPV